MENITITRLREEDLPRLRSLKSHFIIPPKFVFDVQNPAEHGFIAKHEGSIVGFIEYEKTEEVKTAKIRADVFPEWRKKGVGNELFREMGYLLRSKGITHMRFAGKHARGTHPLSKQRTQFLKSVGFERQGEYLVRRVR